MLHTYLYNNVKLVSFKEGEVVMNAEAVNDPHFTRTIAKFISKWTGRILASLANQIAILPRLYMKKTC